MAGKVFAALGDIYVQKIGSVVRKGETVREGHVILEGHADLFEEIKIDGEPTYEVEEPLHKTRSARGAK